VLTLCCFFLSDFSSVSFAVGGIVYEGVRELAGFLEFIKENAVHEYTLPEINHDEL
jgi:hypothetical protein|tara:strand:- start:193 stop:360 length:168 start_codon:yes stop_codon:yes gene_type:complete